MSRTDGFDIPVVLFFFNRTDLILKVLDRVASVKPRKLYLFSDGGRNGDEWRTVLACREAVEHRIDWECEIIRNYAETNRGVYESIGKGALWVFEREARAIFLEDDNLPETTFFCYCEEMLDRYAEDKRVLWVCGTNYLEDYKSADGSSYMFTRHLLPCGWASWSHKFLAMYDGNLYGLSEPDMIKRLEFTYENKALFRQQRYNFQGTYEKLRTNQRVSWDHQMCFSIRANSVFGIAPCHNQIVNIGADERSTHGGTGMHKTMTKRFCCIKSKPLEWPLIHPKRVMPDFMFETKTCNVILMPFSRRIVLMIVRFIKPIFGFGRYESISLEALKKKVRI